MPLNAIYKYPKFIYIINERTNFMENNKQALTVQTGERIRYFRILKRLSQEELALNAGINPTYIGHIERGLKCPTIDTLSKICTALNVTLSQLLDFDSNTPIIDNSEAIEKISFNIKNLPKEDADRIADIVAEIVKIRH